MRECAFCVRQAAKLTGEHVWSAWIVELLKPLTSGYRFTRWDETGAYKKWHSPKMDQKTNVVCKDCNEGWMSDIETEAKQTLSWIIRDGARVSLLTRGIVTLAVFAFKCAVVANYMALNESPFFTPHTRHRFRESLIIPAGVHMWLAAFQGKHLFAGRFIAYYAK